MTLMGNQSALQIFSQISEQCILQGSYKGFLKTGLLTSSDSG